MKKFKITKFSRIPHFTLGFTLIEMLVVVFIIATISTISIANFRAGEKQKRAVLASDTVINALRNAQNFTLSGRSTNNSNPACRVPQYYQITFTYAAITLYGHNNCSTDDLIETYPLPPNTRIKNPGLYVDSAAPATTSMSIAFYPPFATSKLSLDSGAYAAFTIAAIIVETTDGSINKNIQVDGVAGRIGL